MNKLLLTYIIPITLVLSLSVLADAAAQSGDWIWLDPLPNANRISDFHVFNENRIIVVGSAGTILLTENRGETWEEIDSGTTIQLNTVFFADDQTGWIGGQSRAVFKSTDGGRSWSSSMPFGFNIGGIKDYHFIDDQTGWAVNDALFPAQKIMKTTDGGTSWDFKTPPAGLPTATRFSAIFFTDPQTGWAVGSGGAIIHTKDGGETWILQDSGDTNPLDDLFFVDSMNGWAVGNNLLRTVDGGENWTSQPISGSFNSVFFIDENRGWASGSRVIRTLDGGENWDEIARSAPVRPTSSIFSGIHFFDSQNGTGFAGFGVHSTSNGGDSWEYIKNGTSLNFNSISFSDENLGWGVGSRRSVFHSTDGGVTWTPQNAGSGSGTFNAVQFVNSTTGWAAGDLRFIYRTTDGGNTWIQTETGLPDRTRIESIHFLDESTGWIAGRDLRTIGPAQIIIARTTDGGITWERQDDLSEGRIEGIHFVNSLKGWAAGDRNSINTGTVLHTSDGGQTWSVQLEGAGNLSDLFFVDENTGWAVGVTDLLHTSDGGETWVSQRPGSGTSNLKSVHFTDPLNGWIVGNIGIMLYTDDGGNSWNTVPPITDTSFNEVLFLDKNTGWVTGMNALLKFESGDVTSLIDETETTQPSEIRLNQNYPNPFNPATVISFELPAAGMVTLEVFDMLGRKVTTLASGQFPGGSHQVTFDASHLASGVYLYRIQADNFVQTRKLTLLK